MAAAAHSGISAAAQLLGEAPDLMHCAEQGKGVRVGELPQPGLARGKADVGLPGCAAPSSVTFSLAPTLRSALPALLRHSSSRAASMPGLSVPHRLRSAGAWLPWALLLPVCWSFHSRDP